MVFRPSCTERVVEPYALALQWGNWYLAGFCHLRSELRTFRVDRIQKLETTQETFEVPAGFSAREHLSRMSEERPATYYRIAVRFDPEVSHIVRERQEDWQELVEHEDGSVTLSFEASDLAWPCRWVLTYQDRATVLGPPELAARVRKAAESIAARYTDESG